MKWLDCIARFIHSKQTKQILLPPPFIFHVLLVENLYSFYLIKQFILNNNYIVLQTSMSMIGEAQEIPSKLDQSKITPSSKESFSKNVEGTADKTTLNSLSEIQKIRIRNQIFALYKNQILKGKIKVKEIEDLSSVELIFYHKVINHDVQQNIKVNFTLEYPFEPPKLQIQSCLVSNFKNAYSIPNFLLLNEMLSKERWNEQVKLYEVLASIYLTIDDFHQSQIQRLTVKKQQQPYGSFESLEELEEKEVKEEEAELESMKKQRRKSSNMTGCADKQLTETKNLNRHFRSKLREVLRDLVVTPEDAPQDYRLIDSIFMPNRVGFEDIRKALSNKWFNEGVRKQMNSGQFLHKILRGMMGIKSKKLMIKYYHVMASAVQQPSSFIRWKYD